MRQLADIAESGEPHAEFFGYEGHRRLHLKGGGPIEGSAQGIVLAVAERQLRDIARPKSGRSKTAHQLRPALEMIEHPQPAAAPAAGRTALHVQYADDVRI